MLYLSGLRNKHFDESSCTTDKVAENKTKLVPCIRSIVDDDFSRTWIESFMGSGVVTFNVAPHSALLCDTNIHLINFYKAI